MTRAAKRHREASPHPCAELEPRNAKEEADQILQATEASLLLFPCPLCQRSYASSEIDRHVNACLDASSVPTHDENTGKSAFAVHTEESRTVLTSEWAAIMPGQPTKAAKKRVPFYKILEGMPLSVDAFRYGRIDGCEGYFLTHFHSDHYAGLSSRWEHGPIYCSEETARLVHKRLKVAREWIRPLPMNVPQLLPRTGGVRVTCMDANHCPGACLFLFEGPRTVPVTRSGPAASQEVRYLHCGDFRACPAQTAHPALEKQVDIVYLDTTYLHPQYNFPPQAQVIKACVDVLLHPPRRPTLADLWHGPAECEPQAPLVIVGTYSLGKERLVKQLARSLHTSVYCAQAHRHEILLELDDAELHRMLTRQPLEARVHVVSLQWISHESVASYVQALQKRGMRITQTTAFRPTGWTFQRTSASLAPTRQIEALLQASRPPDFRASALTSMAPSTAAVRIVNVPYSEHSSFYELLSFLLTLHPARVVPTVNVGSAVSRQRMQAWLAMCAHASAAQRCVQPRSPDYW